MTFAKIKDFIIPPTWVHFHLQARIHMKLWYWVQTKILAFVKRQASWGWRLTTRVQSSGKEKKGTELERWPLTWFTAGLMVVVFRSTSNFGTVKLQTPMSRTSFSSTSFSISLHTLLRSKGRTWSLDGGLLASTVVCTGQWICTMKDNCTVKKICSILQDAKHIFHKINYCSLMGCFKTTNVRKNHTIP